MVKQDDVLSEIRAAASQQVLFLPHAVRQMARPDRMIAVNEVKAVIESGEIIEDYPEDARGHSALLLGAGAAERPVHVVCSPKHGFLAVITAYLPDPAEWSDDFRRRVGS